MSTAQEALDQLAEINGYVGACIVDSDSGMMLASNGGGSSIDLEVAAAGNTEVVRAKRATMRSLDLDDRIDDILITLDKQFHLIRPVNDNDALFVYLVIDKAKANLAMARHSLRTVEQDLEVV